MITQIFKIDKESPQPHILAIGAECLQNGGVVAFPTETVYGLGANALNSKAVEEIFAAKGRPADNPLIIHVSDLAGLEQVAYITPVVEKLAAAFWPGPLTMVLPKKPNVPEIVTAGLDTVAVRIPGHRVALELIKVVGLPIAAPSANTSGRPSPTTAQHVLEDLDGKIPLILDGGPVEIGLESTVLDLSKPQAKILRPGGITREVLTPYLQGVEYFSGNSSRPAAPGMKYTHYAPLGKVVLADTPEILTLWQEYSAQKPLVIGWQESLAQLPSGADIHILGRKGDLPSYARNIFAAFRLADAKGAKILIVEKVPEEGLGTAIMNRLKKAASSS